MLELLRRLAAAIVYPLGWLPATPTYLRDRAGKRLTDHKGNPLVP
jgi:hypothetical protein